MASVGLQLEVAPFKEPANMKLLADATARFEASHLAMNGVRRITRQG